MVIVEAKGYEIVLTVHDELITENVTGSLEEFKKLMSTTPSWGKDIPLKVGAWCGDRYRK
jgi:DNA polymerase bacteriophage-type